MTALSAPGDRDRSLIAPIGFAPAFTLTLRFETMPEERTPHGGRIMRKIIGGEIAGRITGSVYPSGGGEYSLRRDDGVIDHHSHVMLRTEEGEWFYIRNMGYVRPDGYERVTSWVDVDVRSAHNWTLGLFFIGFVTNAEYDVSRTAYFEVL